MVVAQRTPGHIGCGAGAGVGPLTAGAVPAGVVQTATGPWPINADDAYRLAHADVDQQLRYGDQLVSPNAEAGTPGDGV